MLQYKQYQATSDKPQQIVFLLHGYGSNQSDLISIAPDLAKYLPGALFISPNAHDTFEESDGYAEAYQWFSLRDRSEEAMLINATNAAKKLEQFINQIVADNDLTMNDTVLAGFSQGAMMSMHLGLRMSSQLRGILAYSGLLIAPAQLAREIMSKPPVMLIHGAEDQVVPVSQMHAAHKFLAYNHVQSYTHESKRLGHGIDSEGIKVGGEFLQSVFGHQNA